MSVENRQRKDTWCTFNGQYACLHRNYEVKEFRGVSPQYFIKRNAA